MSEETVGVQLTQGIATAAQNMQERGLQASVDALVVSVGALRAAGVEEHSIYAALSAANTAWEGAGV